MEIVSSFKPHYSFTNTSKELYKSQRAFRLLIHMLFSSQTKVVSTNKINLWKLSAAPNPTIILLTLQRNLAVVSWCIYSICFLNFYDGCHSEVTLSGWQDVKIYLFTCNGWILKYRSYFDTILVKMLQICSWVPCLRWWQVSVWYAR